MSDEEKPQPLGDPIPVGPDLRGTLKRDEAASRDEPRPPRVHRRRTRWIMLATVTVVVLAIAVLAALFLTMYKPPLDAANAYFGDLAAGDFTDAYGRLCEESKESVTVEQYTTEVERSLSGIFAIEGYSANPFTIDVNGGRASVDLEITYATAGSDDVTLDLREEGGDWRPCVDTDQFTITSAPTTTTPATTEPATTTVAPEPAAT